MPEHQPAEHCGHQPSEVFTWRHPGQYGECVLRPGHQGSHADEHGMRWWLHTEEQPDTATDSKQPAYDAVFAYLRSQPVDFMPLTVVDRNAMIWHAVHAALDAAPGPEQQGNPRVQGRCPACGNTRLFLGSGGYVTCPRIDCPAPDAASTLLEENAGTTSVTIEPDPSGLVTKLARWAPACAEGRHFPPHPGDTCDEADAFITARDQWITTVMADAYRAYDTRFTETLITGHGTGEPLGLLTGTPIQPDQPTAVQRALDILRPHLAVESLYRKA
ncbi:hypothetical protein ACFVDT_07090 [Streptomyces sp. NPDC057699]|uniref:hypothetical protein n=1 Tax=Streptomyces sp. NPDC057699 TaxID=3346220 RepID=UPI0036AE4DBF